MQLKQVPGGRGNCPTASQSCHPTDTATSPRVSITWLLCPFTSALNYSCVCVRNEALPRGSAFLSFHLSCLPPPFSRWAQVRKGWDGPQTQVWGKTEKRRGEGKRTMPQHQRLRTYQCPGISPDYLGATEGGFSWLSIWNMSWGETGSTEGDQGSVSD
jgi:hypothetical protein